MAYVHRYFTKASVEQVRLACSTVRGLELRIGRFGAWSCVESNAPVLDLELLARLSAPAGEALGLLVHTGAESLGVAQASEGRLLGEYLLLEGQRESNGSPPIKATLDPAEDTTEALERVEAYAGIPILEPMVAVFVHRRGLEASRSGWLLAGAGTLGILVDALLHVRATVFSVGAMSAVFAGFMLVLRFRRLFERIGMALLASVFDAAIVFMVVQTVLRR